ncbi:hypothetical protein TRIATDRAFT_257827 [Trichoderma atroviride IMI 206040]|uniref:Uncharacterized protein n=1 Tax=Hypocrea atroviridis (strain ATCC 20476 / IMI 206040) TaxID=452589 RepID=G9NXK7_HYPAI|nr:uncharacterized protein TRIATDRAFT_257827 [Trichoderma atroviride IMI 206040]EHK44187.1 hypothetical protein TRIATDRAFT_257827 [Trichoderma atroviride IMI 206040]
MSSHTASAAAFLAPGRTPVKAPEGYRGTALGDGRAGYAKPEPYGSAYNTPSPTTTAANTVSPVSFPSAQLAPAQLAPAHADAAELGNDNLNANKWHDSNAAEIDGNAVMGHQSGPVYEMPTQTYH